MKYDANISVVDLNGDTVFTLCQNERIVDLLDVAFMKQNRENSRNHASLGLVTGAFENLSIIQGPRLFNQKVEAEKITTIIKNPKNPDNLPVLLDVLEKEGLGKYLKNFQARNCDFNVFLTLNEKDLKEVYDIKLFGPRRKLFLLIKKMRNTYL